MANENPLKTHSKARTNWREMTTYGWATTWPNTDLDLHSWQGLLWKKRGSTKHGCLMAKYSSRLPKTASLASSSTPRTSPRIQPNQPDAKPVPIQIPSKLTWKMTIHIPKSKQNYFVFSGITQKWECPNKEQGNDFQPISEEPQTDDVIHNFSTCVHMQWRPRTIS